MTAIRARRSRGVLVALIASVVGLFASAALAYAGWQTLSDSTAGRRVDVDEFVLANQRFPFTPTAVIGTADDDGRLTSVVVAVLEPDGTGGSLVSLSASADTNLGLTEELRPLAASYTVEGPDAFLSGVGNLTTMSFDVVEIVDAERFTSLVNPLGELTIDLPGEVDDPATGVTWPAGEDRYTPGQAASIVTAGDAQVADWAYDGARNAVWSAVAERVGAGIGSAEAVESDDELPVIADLDTFIEHLFAGPVDYRSLTEDPYPDEVVTDRIGADLRLAYGVPSVDSVVLHRRGESALVFATIAPGRMGSPREGQRYRIRWGFSADDLDPYGINAADATIEAIDRLLFIGGNVVSVARVAANEIGDATTVIVTPDDVIPALEDGYTDLFGTVDLQPRTVEITGVDVEVTLGRDFLETLDVEAMRRNAADATTVIPTTTAEDALDPDAAIATTVPETGDDDDE